MHVPDGGQDLPVVGGREERAQHGLDGLGPRAAQALQVDAGDAGRDGAGAPTKAGAAHLPNRKEMQSI